MNLFKLYPKEKLPQLIYYADDPTNLFAEKALSPSFIWAILIKFFQQFLSSQNSRKALIVILFCLCISVSADTNIISSTNDVSQNAELKSAVEIFSLQECIDYALKNNYNISISKQSVEIAEIQYKQALSAYWPELMLNSSYTRLSEAPNFIFPAQPMNLGSQSVIFAQSIANAQLAQQGVSPAVLPGGLPAFQAMLDQTTQQVLQGLSTTPMPAWDVKIMERNSIVNSLNFIYPLFTGGQISSVIKQAKAGIEAAKQKSYKTDLQIIYDVKKYYYASIFSEKIQSIGETALARLEATLELTENLYKKGSGRVKKTDYLRNKIIVEGVRSAVALLNGNKKLAYSALINTLGLNWDMEIELVDKNLPYNPYNLNA